MSREPLAIVLSVATVLACMLMLALAQYLDVAIDDTLALAGVVVLGVGSAGAYARSKVTPVKK